MPEKGKGRRRGRVEMKRIENQIRRQITFSKRKAGLLKKVAELSLLCDVDLALIISSPSGKLYHSPAPNIDKALRRYQKHFSSPNYCAEDYENIELLQQELEKGRKIETELERMQKHMNGEDLDCLNFKEIQYLEQKMEIGATMIHSRKERLLQKDIRSLKTKLKRREVDTDRNDLEGGPINGTVDDHINGVVDDHINGTVDDPQQPHQKDGDANGVARLHTNLQYHTNLSLSLF